MPSGYVALTSSDLVFHYLFSSMDSSKDTILLLHPGATDSSYFRGQFADVRITSRYNLLAFDERGHGQSRATPIGTVTQERKTRCLIEGLDKLKLSRLHLYGEGNNGCTTALFMAILRPDLVRSICLFSPLNDPITKDEHRLYTDLKDKMLANKQNGDQTGRIDAAVLGHLYDVLQGTSMHSDPVQKQEFMAQLSERYGQGHTAEEVEEMIYPMLHRRCVPETMLEDITCPVLILHGENDGLSNQSSAINLQTALGNNAQLHTIHGGCHFISRSMPTIASRYVLRFLEQFARKASAGPMRLKVPTPTAV